MPGPVSMMMISWRLLVLDVESVSRDWGEETESLRMIHE